MAEKFITDNGGGIRLEDEDGDMIPLERYGVWWDLGRGKPEVGDLGDDLDALKAKHGDVPVIKLPSAE